MAEQERRVQAGLVETLEAEAAEVATPLGSAPIAPVRMIARTATLARSTPAEPTAAAYRVSRAAGRPRSAAAARVRSVVRTPTAATATNARTIAVSAARAPTLPTTRSARRTSTVRSTKVAGSVKSVPGRLPAPIRVRARPIAAPTTGVFTTTARTARCVARTAAAPSVATIRNALRRMLVTRALVLQGSARWSIAARASNAVTTARVRRPAAIAAARPNATTTSPVRTTGAPRVPARTRRIPVSVRGTTPVIRFAAASRPPSVQSTPIALCSNARPPAARPVSATTVVAAETCAAVREWGVGPAARTPTATTVWRDGRHLRRRHLPLHAEGHQLLGDRRRLSLRPDAGLHSVYELRSVPEQQPLHDWPVREQPLLFRLQGLPDRSILLFDHRRLRPVLQRLRLRRRHFIAGGAGDPAAVGFLQVPERHLCGIYGLCLLSEPRASGSRYGSLRRCRARSEPQFCSPPWSADAIHWCSITLRASACGPTTVLLVTTETSAPRRPSAERERAADRIRSIFVPSPAGSGLAARQGENGWLYGYWNASADADGSYDSSADFVEMEYCAEGLRPRAGCRPDAARSRRVNPVTAGR